MNRWLVPLALAAVAEPVSAQAQVESDKDKIHRLEGQVQSLMARLDALEAASRKPAPPTQPAVAPPAAVVAAAKPAVRGASDMVPVTTSPRGGVSDPDRGTTLASANPVNVPIGPSDHSLGAPDRPAQFLVSASTGSSQASFSVTRTIGRPNLNGRSSGVATYSSLTLGAQAPLDKGGGNSDIATLDGLANSFALKIGFSQARVGISTGNSTSAALEAKAVAACKADPSVNPAKDCDLEANRSGILSHYLSTTEFETYQNGGFTGGAAIVFGLNGRIGYNKFSYLDPATGAKASLSSAPWSVGGYATLLPNLTATSLTAGIEYQRTFKEQPVGVLCPAGVFARPTVCPSSAIGAPKKQDKILLSLEGRKLFPTGSSLLPTIGIAPQMTYDAQGKKLGLDLPIYIASDNKTGLLGGVRVGWTNTDGGFVAGIFVGAPFSLFQGK